VRSSAADEEAPGDDVVIITEGFTRAEPFLSPRTTEFWRAGSDGVLRIARCQTCGRYRHPPRPVCAACHGDDIRFEDVSGHGRVWSWTVNHYAWAPEMPPPYVVALVDLAEQPGLRLMSNLVECELDRIEVDMAVEVCFARTGDAHIPLFRPLSRPTAAEGAP
jgi:uncharacterized OB-fold protein